jgi:hypothetical protein
VVPDPAPGLGLLEIAVDAAVVFMSAGAGCEELESVWICLEMLCRCGQRSCMRRTSYLRYVGELSSGRLEISRHVCQASPLD